MYKDPTSKEIATNLQETEKAPGLTLKKQGADSQPVLDYEGYIK